MYQANLLFDSEGIPRIFDFGNASMISDPYLKEVHASCFYNNLQWTAPELLVAKLNDEAVQPTKMSDVHAFGMVVVEVGCVRFSRRLEV